MDEVWKDVVGCEGRYRISSFGRVWTTKYKGRSSGRLLKPTLRKDGYCRVSLQYAGNKGYPSKGVHRVVAEAFIPNPNNLPEVNHIDGDKTNNHFTNLEWVTEKQNSKHAWENGLCENVRQTTAARNGEKSPTHKLTWKQVETIRQVYQYPQNNSGPTMKTLAGWFQVSIGTIRRVLHNRTWKQSKQAPSIIVQPVAMN